MYGLLLEHGQPTRVCLVEKTDLLPVCSQLLTAPLLGVGLCGGLPSVLEFGLTGLDRSCAYCYLLCAHACSHLQSSYMLKYEVIAFFFWAVLGIEPRVTHMLTNASLLPLTPSDSLISFY